MGGRDIGRATWAARDDRTVNSSEHGGNKDLFTALTASGSVSARALEVRTRIGLTQNQTVRCSMLMSEHLAATVRWAWLLNARIDLRGRCRPRFGRC